MLTIKIEFLTFIQILDHYLWVGLAVKSIELFVDIGVRVERRHPLPQSLLILIKIKVIFVAKCGLRSPGGNKVRPRFIFENLISYKRTDNRLN